MEEVRSYWQVASIHHFCTLFQKPFKLPSFEPEELEQAFVIDVPEPPKSISSSFNSINNNHNTNINNERPDSTNDDDQRGNNSDDDGDADYHDPQSGMGSRKPSSEYLPSNDTKPLPDQQQPQQHQQQPQQNEDPQELHLLVKLAIALLKPHFNSKIR